MGFPPGEHRIFVRTEDRGEAIPPAAVIQGHYGKFGEVVDVYRPPSSPDICYVTFANELDMKQALQETRVILADVVCNVQQAVPRGARPAWMAAPVAAPVVTPAASVYVPPPGAYAPSAIHRVFVTGMVDQVDEDLLKTYFTYFGHVKDVYIPIDRTTGLRKPFAFVTMATAEETATILQMPAHHLGEGVTVNVMHAEPREMAGKGAGVYAPMPYTPTPTSLPSTAGMAPDTSKAPTRAPVPTSATPRPSTPQQAPLITIAEQEYDYEYEEEGASNGTDGAWQEEEQQQQPEEPQQLQPQQPQQPQPQATAGGGGPVWQPGGGPLQGVPGPHRLFVFGMPEGLNGDMLRGHFARHGELLDVYVPPRSPDIAYITFSTEEELQDALQNSGLRIAGYWVKGMKAAEQREKGTGKASGKGGAVHYRPY